MMFGEYLVKEQLISLEQLEEAVAIQSITKKKLGRILVELGYLAQENCDLAIVNFKNLKPHSEPISSLLDQHFQSKTKTIKVGSDQAFLVQTLPNKLVMNRYSDLLVQKAETVTSEFETIILGNEQWKVLTSILIEKPKDFVSSTDEYESNLPVQIVATPYRDLLYDLLAKAKTCHASDVHFDSTSEGVTIRFRVNGDLTTIKLVKHELAQSFLTEVKSNTGLPLTVIGTPCSGSAKFPHLNLKVRSQSNGQIHGETIVLRLIDEEKTKDASIDAIGADYAFKTEVRKALGFSNGLILICGQTGSGKSWTLYSLLMELDRNSSKVITIEDPVEYEGPGLMQIEVSDGKIDFKNALRSSLRLDPDVLMIGEIRDEETAELAFKAASTGHLVLSTLHTNGALEALTRLKGLGIAEDVIDSNVRLISALSLKKSLCNCCKLKVEIDEIRNLNEELEGMAFDEVQFFKRNPLGCSNSDCYRGATGRVLVYESITQEQIREFRRNNIIPGFRTLKQYTLEKSASGIIDIEDTTND